MTAPSIFRPVADMTPAELQAEHDRLLARVEYRYRPGRGVHTADSRREQLDEDRLHEVEAELDVRERRRKAEYR